MTMNTKQSEFGRGCGYCLGLFLAHVGNFEQKLKCSTASMWFYAAADHLYEFQIPDMMSKKFSKRAHEFGKFVFARRLVMDSDKKPTRKDVYWAIDEAKELLRLLDEELGIKTIKAEFR